MWITRVTDDLSKKKKKKKLSEHSLFTLGCALCHLNIFNITNRKLL
jgi:hypothetical protein